MTLEQWHAIQERLCDDNPYGLWGNPVLCNVLGDMLLLVAEICFLKDQLTSAADRIHKQSELLSRRAEK